MSEQSSSAWWRRSRRNLSALAGILLLGILLYAHTLTVPWYLDDLNYVVGNYSVQNLGQAWSELLTSSRGLVQFTFALNYWFGTTSVFGYHLVNILIHLGTSCLVFLILKRVFADSLLLAWGGALIFLAHPLQTQSVTYLYQRATCLAGLFFFLAVYLYIRARESEPGSQEQKSSRSWRFYAGALVCGALAVLAKPNTAVLPVALLLFDRYFLPQNRTQSWRQIFLYLLPFCLAPTILGLKGLIFDPMLSDGATPVGAFVPLAHLSNNTPLNYLVTQFGVIWIYVRLLFLPYGQALEYDVPVVSSFWHWPSMVGLLGIVLLLTAAVRVRKRQPVVSAGIFWFFLALSIESSVIPLDTVFEHRLYIPMFGFVLVVMAGMAMLPRRMAVGAIVLVSGTLAVLTWQRNALWNDPVAFYEDNLRRAPRNERVHLNLANAYTRLGRLDAAQRSYEQALALNPQYAVIYTNLSRIYAMQGDYQKAIATAREGLRIDPTLTALYNNLAAYHNALGDYHAAADALQTAIRLNPDDDPLVYLNLGMAYEGMGFIDRAIQQYRRMVELAPADQKGHFFLGNALLKSGDARGALPEFLVAYRLNPDHAGTLYKIALISMELGDLVRAREFAAQLQRIDPKMAEQLPPL